MAKLAIIDTIGALEDEVKRLKAKIEKLKSKVVDYRGVGSYEGDEYEASVYEMEQTLWNFDKIRKLIAKAGKKEETFKRTNSTVCMRVEKKGRRAVAAAKAVATKKAKAVAATKKGIKLSSQIVLNVPKKRRAA